MGFLMLVKFISTEAGEIVMYADLARALLQAVGKECTAHGVFTQAELADAIQKLQAAVARSSAPPAEEDEDEEPKEKPVTFGARAWPLIKMLERTQGRGDKAHVVWQAASAF